MNKGRLAIDSFSRDTLKAQAPFFGALVQLLKPSNVKKLEPLELAMVLFDSHKMLPDVWKDVVKATAKAEAAAGAAADAEGEEEEAQMQCIAMRS